VVDILLNWGVQWITFDEGHGYSQPIKNKKNPKLEAFKHIKFCDKTVLVIGEKYSEYEEFPWLKDPSD